MRISSFLAPFSLSTPLAIRPRLRPSRYHVPFGRFPSSNLNPIPPCSKLLSYSRPTSQSNPHRAYYQTHGRALFKCLTLAFLTYQIVYWAWLTLETDEIKANKEEEIKGLEAQARMLQKEQFRHGSANGVERTGQK